MTDQVEITDGVKNLVFDELVFKPQAIGIKNAVFVHDDGIVQTAAAGQPDGTQGLDFTGEPEGSGARNGLDVGVLLEIDLGEIRRGINGRVLEIDGKGQGKAIVGLETGPLGILAFTFAHFDGLEHAQELLRCSLFLQPGAAQQIHEGTGASVHDGHFFGGKVDMQIVDAQAGKGGHQVFNG